MNEKTQQPKQLSRRSFLKMGMAALSTLAFLEVGGASLLFMQPRVLEGQFGGVVSAGAIDSFTPGTVTEFPDGRFYLIRAADGGFLAIYNRCTHLGCTVSWQPEQNGFFCPCHASHFDERGEVNNPPATRPLDTLAIRFEEGTVLVDTGRVLSRDRFTAEQLAYA